VVVALARLLPALVKSPDATGSMSPTLSRVRGKLPGRKDSARPAELVLGACGFWLSTIERWRDAMRHRPHARASCCRRRSAGMPRARLCGFTARSIRELKGVRHLFRHAYDLDLDPERVHAAAGNAARCVGEFAGWCREFLATVRSRYRDELDA